MKKILRFLALWTLALAAVVSCAKKEFEPETIDIPDSSPATLYRYTFDLPETRATLDNNGAFWEESFLFANYLCSQKMCLPRFLCC